MNQPVTRGRLRSVCLCACASWLAIIPAIGGTSETALAAKATATATAAVAATATPNPADSGCAVPAPVALSLESSATPVAAAASPVAAAASPVAATPVAATATATPGASSAAAATGAESDAPVNVVTADAIRQTVQAVAACQSAGDYATLGQLFTARYLSDFYGGGEALSAAQFVQLGTSLPRVAVTIHSVTDIAVDASGVVSADVVWVSGHQLLHARWTFAAKPNAAGDNTGGETGATDGIWQVDDFDPLAVELGAAAQTLTVAIKDNAYSPTALKASHGADILISAKNSGKQDHELLVLKLGKSMKVSDLLLSTGPALPKGVTFIGQVTIPAKSEGELALTGLDKGSYVIVDLLPDPDGIPHLSNGMSATLTIS